MSDAKTYTGGCHCGKTRYEMTADLSKGVVACNCSICQKRGHWLTFVPDAQFKLLSGAETQTSYLFGKKSIDHQFCSVCGVSSFAKGAMPDGSPIFAVNVRCLEGVDLDALSVKKVDGKSL